MEQNLQLNKRIESIDIVRGIVMVIMALDHVRDFFHVSANIDNPLNLSTTTNFLFFTRYITHFCAPTFVFLSGTSIYLQSLIKTKKELSLFLLKRGLWLIFAELFIISLAWTFDPFFHFFGLQVIWAIGISMVIMSLIVQFNYKMVLAIGLIIVFGHNLLDFVEASPNFKHNLIFDLIHSGRDSLYSYLPNRVVMIIYPFLPWTGLMILGYCLGKLYTPAFTQQTRIKILRYLGLSLLVFFVILRYANFYGDPNPWTTQKSGWFTFLSFLDIHKYPPSLLYMSITVGVTLLALSITEKIKSSFSNVAVIYGRTAFFYYILHFYFIHLFATLLFFIRGEHTVTEALKSMEKLPFLFVFPGEGYSLGVVYIIWIGLVLLLYPLCKWYNQYKTNHKEKWWLSYL